MNMHKNARLTPAGREVAVRRVMEEGWSKGEVARSMAVSKRTIYKWIHRFLAEGVAGLEDRSSRPHRCPTQLPESTVAAIVRLRRQKRWTARRIARSLRLTLSTVGRWLRRLGMGQRKQLDEPEEIIRYERDRPGDLLHLDTKKLGRFERVGHRIHGDRRRKSRRAGWEYLHVCVDDHTRVSYVEVLDSEGAESSAAFVGRALEWYASLGITVRQVMTDNGSGYVSSRFRDELHAWGVRHLRTRPYRPQTNGKAERFIQTALREWAYLKPYRTSNYRQAVLPHFMKRYNERREHASLDGQTPLSRLQASL